ncbi:MAG: HNH endonuclease [bacterium]
MSTSRPVYRADLSARQVHSSLLTAIDHMIRAERNAVLWFGEVLRRQLFRDLGYSSILQYGTEALEFSQAKVYQFIRLAERLESLPDVKDRVATGAIPWTKARIISGVATVATQADWLRAAEQSNCRQLEAKVRQAKLSGRQRAKVQVAQAQGAVLGVIRETARQAREGSAAVEMSPPADVATDAAPPADVATDAAQLALLPTVEPLPAAESRLSVKLEFTPEQFARFEVLLEAVRKQGDRSSREELLLAGMEALLKTPVNTADPAAPTGECTHVQNENRYQVVVNRCPDCGSGTVPTSRGDRRLSPAVLSAIECDARIWVPGKPNRASIPPATRRAVLTRDGYRCQAPGCEKARFLEVHHRLPRQQGGSNQPENLITLCSGCHRQAHAHGLAGLDWPVEKLSGLADTE